MESKMRAEQEWCFDEVGGLVGETLCVNGNKKPSRIVDKRREELRAEERSLILGRISGTCG